MNLRSLTGLRFLAAAMVFGHHAVNYGGAHAPGTYSPLFPGMVGVSFFFVLSGFLLAWSHRPDGSARDFWQRRFARVYPAYFVAWLAVCAVNIVMGDGFKLTDAISLTLTQAWFPSQPIYFAVSGVFWSLSAEAFFYLIFPAIIKPLTNLGSSGRLAAIAAIVALVFGIAAVTNPLVEGSVSHWLLYFFPPTRALEFVLGILAALHLKSGRIPNVSLAGASVTAAAAFVVAGFVPGSFMRVAVTLVPFAVLIVAAAQADVSGRVSIFRARALVTLGEWSYAFYLVHATAIWVYLTAAGKLFHFDLRSAGPLESGAQFTVALVCSVAAAGIVYRWVEHPLNARLRPKRAEASADAKAPASA